MSRCIETDQKPEGADQGRDDHGNIIVQIREFTNNVPGDLRYLIFPRVVGDFPSVIEAIDWEYHTSNQPTMGD